MPSIFQDIGFYDQGPSRYYDHQCRQLLGHRSDHVVSVKGDAVVGTATANLLSGQPRVEKLSMLPRSGGALGFMYTPPTNEDGYLLFVDELRGRLVTLLGGRASKEVVYSGGVSTGALDDILRTTDMAYKAISEYGLNETVVPLSLTTLSGGGVAPFGRDQGYLVDLVQREVKALLQLDLGVALSPPI